MSHYVVTTPEPGHNGKLGQVEFVGGVTRMHEVTHAAELAYARAVGYTVNPEPAPEAEAQPEPDRTLAVDAGAERFDTTPQPPTRPKKTAPVGDWRTYAVAAGRLSVDEADAHTKNQLVELFADDEEIQ